MGTKRAICLITGYYLLFSVKAQVPVVQTPEVASINKYIDVPVDKSTGIPAIKMPLYTLNEHGYTLPVAVNYHAGGIRVEEMAGCAGLGWSLSTTNIISRTVKGMPDEMGGYYEHHGFGTLTSTLIDNKIALSTGGKDLEPDIFYFSVNGYAGKFLFDDQRRIHIIPEQDVKIEMTSTVPALFTFKITTPDGAQYIFDNTRTNSINLSPGSYSNVPNAWNVNKIITPNHSEIIFEYHAFLNYNHRLLAPRTNMGIAPNECALGALMPQFGSDMFYVVKRIYSEAVDIIFNFKSSVREDVNNGSISHALDNIEVKDRVNNTVVKKFVFETSYFDCTDIYSRNQLQLIEVDMYLRKRLRLDRIREYDAQGNALPPYEFAYNKINTIDMLPNRISVGQDHWGYYNRMSHALWLMGPYSFEGRDCNIPSYREVSAVHKKAFILDEIKFPTGGTTTFRFDNDAGPGLRIKEITSHPGGNQPPVVKKYTYGFDAIIGGVPIYAQEIPNFQLAPIALFFGIPSGYYAFNNMDCSHSTLPPAGTKYIAYSQPINYTGELAGQHVCYSSVIEEQEGNGSIETYYNISSASDYIDDITIYPFVFKHPLLDVGKPAQIIHKDKGGNILREELFEYNGFYREIITQGKAAKEYRPECAHIVTFYRLYTGFIYLRNKTDVVHDQGNNGRTISTTTTYELGGIPANYRTWGLSEIQAIQGFADPLHHFVTKETTNASDGSIIHKRYKYPIDYRSEIGTPTGTESWDIASKGISELIAQHRIATPVEQITTREINGIETVIGGTLNLPKTSLTPQGKMLVTLDKTNSLNNRPVQNYSSSLFSGIIKNGNTYHLAYNNNYKIETAVDQYDNAGNPLEILGSDGIRQSFVWGYKGQYPIAKAVNAAAKDIFFTSFEEDNDAGIVLDARAGIKSRQNGLQRSLTGLTDGNYVLSYWSKTGGSWNLQSNDITVAGGSYSINIPGQVDEVKFYPAKAHLTSYTYRPSIGVLTINDDRNRLTSYEYDGFGRLLRVRDNEQNIVKQHDYQYMKVLYPSANWQWTGAERNKPCPVDNSFLSPVTQMQYRDNNSSSPTYNQLTWIDHGYNPYNLLTTDWINTNAPLQCYTYPDPNRNNQIVNSGDLMKEAKNINPCSPWFNTTRWDWHSYNPGACPLPQPVTVYVKFFFENVEYQDEYTFADIYIRLFLDAACTQPAVPVDVNINYRISDACTGSQDYILNGLHYYNSVGNGWYLYHQGCNVTYTILPGQGYIIAQ